MKDIIPEPSVVVGPVGSEGGRSPSTLSTGSHPSFEDFACGCTASGHAPDLIKKAEVLCMRYPPRALRSLGPGLCWQSDH
jgi:hypothetical protein